jgi:hypothetical protein
MLTPSGSLIATTTVPMSSTPAARSASSSVQSTTRASIEGSIWRRASMARWSLSIASTSAPLRASSSITAEPKRPTPITAKPLGSGPCSGRHCHQEWKEVMVGDQAPDQRNTSSRG